MCLFYKYITVVVLLGTTVETLLKYQPTSARCSSSEPIPDVTVSGLSNTNLELQIITPNVLRITGNPTDVHV